MRKEKTEKYVGIRCPQCRHIQKARVLKTLPFYTYMHICKKCGYVITESEWDEVKQPTNK
jgi:C4-type Zn-finger protein